MPSADTRCTTNPTERVLCDNSAMLYSAMPAINTATTVSKIMAEKIFFDIDIGAPRERERKRVGEDGGGKITN
ncbi:hypothetical protein FACS1894107_13870 [Planctomycetales bacterium]|nr:hypothetical protein FACS1894107_13870 [Planctomycetales bacterium]